MAQVMTDTMDAFVDLQFALKGQVIPLEYADTLWSAVREILPWLEAERHAGIHPLSGLSPSVDADGWYLSRRSRLTLRLAREQAAAAEALVGARLQLGGGLVEIGAAHLRELTYSPVLHAKFVTYGGAGAAPISEADFQTALAAELATLGVAPRLICGKAQQIVTRDGVLTGFSLVLYELKSAAALLLQHRGLGGERKRGCGVFVPHKSAVAFETLE